MRFSKQSIAIIRKVLNHGKSFVTPFTGWVKRKMTTIDDYFIKRPKARKRLIIASMIIGPPYQLMFMLAVVVWTVTPTKKTLRNIQNQVASEIYSADSVLLGRYYIQDRTEVRYDDISPAVIDALVATEDVRFYEHAGIDFVSLGRVLVKSIFLGDESSGGGSTITQQLAKNLFPRKKFWMFSIVVNKMREAVIARRLEDVYSKKDILTLYLNTVPFADNTFGIEAAAQRFYSTSARNLSTEQAAVLIGMLKATHFYNPRLFPERAEDRRNVVIRQMVKYNFLTDSIADSLKVLPMTLSYNKVSHHQGLAPHLREYLKAELMEWCRNHKKQNGDPYNLFTDGLQIYTTIDSKLQGYAEDAVARQMKEVQKMFFEHWGKDKPWKGKEQVLDEAIRRSPRYQKLKTKNGLSEEEIMEELQKPVPTRLFTWDGVKEEMVSPVDSIIHHLQYLNAGFLVMEPQTGKVKAWVGGIDHDFFQFDHVKATTKRQVGSIFKPIVYAMAIEKGIEPCALISAERETYIDKEGKEWTPRNMQNDYEVQYSMRGALAYSVNTVAVKMIQEAGVANTIALARKMGITSEIPDVPSISLGSSSISLIEMASAYACLANEGMAVPPYYISSITDLEGNVFDEYSSGTPRRAFSKETAQILIHMLRTVVHEGTAGRLRWRYGIYNDVAGKTGTTQANADGWFMAMTPNLVMGAWVGADDPRIRFRTTHLGQGSSTALPITGYFLKHVNQDTAYKKISAAKFEPLPAVLRGKLDCDLYELNPDLEGKIVQMIHKRDSITMADTLAEPPKETFLEMLYRRKQKILQVNQPDSAAQNKLDVVGG
jgi:penicillin-binding protein 1A